MLDKIKLIKTAEDLAEHFRQVEAYINHEDITAITREQLFKEIEQSGFDSLTFPQKAFHALSCFEDALANLGIWWFFNNTEADMIDFTAIAFDQLDNDDFSNGFSRARSALTGTPDPYELQNEIEEDVYMDPFMDCNNWLADRIYDYAEVQGLFLSATSGSSKKM
jgi:hypothetical protein